MLIACLGWGSLVWDPRDLPTRGPWFNDGPFLPIEFARQSKNDRITLVLIPGYLLVRSLWVPLSLTNLTEARESLRRRECIPNDKVEEYIAHWDGGKRQQEIQDRIAQWAGMMQIDAVVWTNLPPKFKEETGRIPTAEQVISHLSSLPYRPRRNAKRYVRMTPRQIDTEYRRRIELTLGWTPLSKI